jgi:putative membrane-bound dehydrogenase-like protein
MPIPITKFTLLILVLALSTGACSPREIPLPTPTLAPTAVPVEMATPEPTPVIVVERGQLPPGFSLTVYADVLLPTSLTFGPDGRLYVASAAQNIYVLSDMDGDRRAETSAVFARGLNTPLGLLWIGNLLYVSYNANVVAIEDTDGDGTGDKSMPILTNLPVGLHQNDGMVLAADGYIYMGLGSTCDACDEASPLSATILRFKPDGSGLSVFASGFRNPYDVAFNAAGDLFATDNGRDKLGDDLPPEELNHIRAGLDYGWPDCWEGSTGPECDDQTHAAAGFTAHSSVDGLAFYHAGNFPPGYYDNAFVAVFGSYILPGIERGVKRVILIKDGDTYRSESSWFLQLGTTGHPLDLTVGPDGGLYVADYEQAAVYRIVYGAP